MGRLNSVDLYGDAALVPTTVGAHHVRHLRGGALWAHTASGTLEAPVRRTTSARASLGSLSLGDSHRSSLSVATATPSLPRLGRILVKPEFCEFSPAGIDGRWALARVVVEVNSALNAQPPAGFAAQGRQRELQKDCIVDQGCEVDGVTLVPVRLVIGARCFDEAFVDRHVDRTRNVARAAATASDPGTRDPTTDRNTAGKTRESNVNVHDRASRHIAFTRGARRELGVGVEGGLERDGR